MAETSSRLTRGALVRQKALELYGAIKSPDVIRTETRCAECHERWPCSHNLEQDATAKSDRETSKVYAALGVFFAPREQRRHAYFIKSPVFSAVDVERYQRECDAVERCFPTMFECMTLPDAALTAAFRSKVPSLRDLAFEGFSHA